MNRRKFVLVSTVLMFAVAGLVAGLTMYTSFVAKADIQSLMSAVQFFPKDTQAIIGINVKAFLGSPFYAKIEAEHGDRIGSGLAEFIQKTGVDPRTDLDYVIAGGRSLGGGKGKGAMIAVGRFNETTIVNFIKTKSVPIEVQYQGATVYMIPEQSGSSLEKGIAFLNSGEMALGDLESLQAILDVRAGGASVTSDSVLTPMLQELNPNDMFWFAGDASSIMANSPVNTPFGDKISAIQSIYGTLNLTQVVSGQITAIARDDESATKLADVARGLLALGSLATDQKPELAPLKDIMSGVTIVQEKNRIQLSVNFSADLLDQLRQLKSEYRKAVVAK